MVSHQVLVKTLACAISIGSEIPLYRGDDIGTVHQAFPYEMGYESYGEIVAVGPDVEHLAVGDKVVAFYGQQDYAVCRDDSVIPIPEAIDAETALLAILPCDTAKGVLKLRPQSTDRVLVTGLGTIGLLTVYFLRQYMHVEHVDAVEPNVDRAEMGQTFGVTRCFADSPPTGEQYGFGFECSARNKGFQVLQSAVAQNGKICILSDGNCDDFVLHPKFFENELSIVGSSDGWDYHEHAKWYFDHVLHTPYTSDLFQLKITKESLISCYEDLAAGRIHPLKVFVTYS